KARLARHSQTASTRQRVVCDLRVATAQHAALSLYGPDLENVARTDAQGLRFNLAAGRKDTRPVGIEVSQRLRGDFDIVVGYELLAIGDPVPQYGSGVALRLWLDSPSYLSAIVSRTRKPDNVGSRECYGAHTVTKDAEGKEQYRNNVDKKATSSSGKLRLRR